MRKINKIILHCSDSDLKRQSAAVVDRWHKARGFKKIGYHFFVKKDGVVEQGRKLEEVGAHCKGHNSKSVGVCLAGKKSFNESQFRSLRTLLKTLRRKYPNATVHGHREFNPLKTCPVFDVKPFKQFYEKEEKQWKLLSKFLKLCQKLSKLFSRS